MHQTSTPDARTLWLTAGYDFIANHGFINFKVDEIARQLKRSKSSFYHYFLTPAAFLEEVVELHHEKAIALTSNLRTLTAISEDLYQLLSDNKPFLLFHKHLSILPENNPLRNAMKICQTMVETQLYKLVMAHNNLPHHDPKWQLLFKTGTNDFLYSITELSLTELHIKMSFEKYQNIIESVKQTK